MEKLNLSEPEKKGEILCNEVKKLGLIVDRHEGIELRGGDELVVYVSFGGRNREGDAEK